MNELTKTEEIVMTTIWGMDDLVTLSAVMEILDVEYKEKGWKPQTISTYFRKLVEKKYLKMHRNGKVYSYKTLVSEEQYRNYLVGDVLERFFHGDKQAFIAAVEEK